ncbi:MAG: YdcF family protein, partial [Alphaproteobacteria bacterium]|nr:YdcF family protein [Alphaproteobacteria bacterium]
GFFLLLVLGVLPLGHNILVKLEQHIQPPATMPADIGGILVLGGSLDTGVSGARNMPALNGAADRVLAGVTLAQRYPEAVLVFSGGNNNLSGGGAPETLYVHQLLNDIGYDTRSVFFEDESRNTHENIVFTRKLLMPQPEETWILVTSAWHMPRAAAVMHSMGWPGKVLFWPVDYRTDGVARAWPPAFDVADNMDKTALALHEGIGWLTYRLTGRINPRGEKLEQ